MPWAKEQSNLTYLHLRGNSWTLAFQGGDPDGPLLPREHSNRMDVFLRGKSSALAFGGGGPGGSLPPREPANLADLDIGDSM